MLRNDVKRNYMYDSKDPDELAYRRKPDKNNRLKLICN